MSSILQGTTPTLRIRVNPDLFSVEDLSDIELTLWQGDAIRVLDLSSVTVDAEANVIAYHFTREETLALNANRGLGWQILYFFPDGNTVGTDQHVISVKHLKSEEVHDVSDNNG